MNIFNWVFDNNKNFSKTIIFSFIIGLLVLLIMILMKDFKYINYIYFIFAYPIFLFLRSIYWTNRRNYFVEKISEGNLDIEELWELEKKNEDLMLELIQMYEFYESTQYESAQDYKKIKY